MKPASSLYITSDIQIPMREISFTFARSRGPGGQNVNKVNSKAVLRWAPGVSKSLPENVRARFTARYGNKITAAGELLITSDRYRDAAQNTADCLEKLRVMLIRAALPPKSRRPTRPTAASVRRRLVKKNQRSSLKNQRRLLDDAE